jgi:hypothetical protein
VIALTPQQMRGLADELDEEAQDWDGEGVVGPKFTNGAAALRTAADQLEAVRALSDRWKREGVLSAYTTELAAALTAGDLTERVGVQR